MGLNIGTAQNADAGVPKVEEDFSAAFDDLAKLGEGEAPKTPEPKADDEPPADTGAEAGAEDGAADDEGGAPEGDAPADEGAEDEPVVDEDAADDAEAAAARAQEKKLSDAELLERFATIMKGEPKQEQPAPQQQEQPLFTQEEQEFLTAYEKEWPDVAKAEALRRRAEYRQMLGYIFEQVGQHIAPMAQALNQLSTRTYTTDIYEAVPDYDQVREPVIAWARSDKQPAYLRAAYEQVIKEGTVDEIADLCNRWKQATGKTAPAVAPKAKSDKELPETAKQAAASLAPVKSKRSSVITGMDPSDFEGAFAEFAKDL